MAVGWDGFGGGNLRGGDETLALTVWAVWLIVQLRGCVDQ